MEEPRFLAAGGQPVPLTSAERQQHTHVIGGSGSGRSALLRRLFLQQLLAEPDAAAALIDPHGSLAPELAGHIPEQHPQLAGRLQLFAPFRTASSSADSAAPGLTAAGRTEPALGLLLHQLPLRLPARTLRDRQILLADLAPAGEVDPRQAALLGILLIRELVLAALVRSPPPPPFWLYVDDFPPLLTPDLADLLAEGRKYGLFLTLAHQHLAQLRREDEYLYASVMTNCRNRFIAGELPAEDAALLELRSC